MARKLTLREARMLQVGAVVVVVILAFTFGLPWIDDWRVVRASIAESQAKLTGLEADQAQYAALRSMVPVFEAPQPEEKQKFLFRDKLHEQLRKAGIDTQPLQMQDARPMKKGPYAVLKIQCKGKGKFDQVLDFLAGLKENPYLVGIEELRLECDTKQPPEKREQVDVQLTVSTFVKAKQSDATKLESDTDEVGDRP
jgi:Tfp pilus assembly protein PilO